MKITADGCMHYSHWASQPDVLIACGLEADTWTVLYPEHMKDKLYGSAEAHGYTFDRDLVTCTDCLEWIKKNPIQKIRMPLGKRLRRILCFHDYRPIHNSVTGKSYVKQCIKCKHYKTQ